ncbi:hypothetical protein ACWDPV_21730 [Gordonia sp. NPDC003504]
MHILATQRRTSHARQPRKSSTTTLTSPPPYKQELDQIRDHIHRDHTSTDAGSGAGATEPADTDVVDADVVDAESVDADAADGDAGGEAESVDSDATAADIDNSASSDADSESDHEDAAPTVGAETPSDRGVSKDHPAPAADWSNVVDSFDEGDDHESGVADQPEPGVDKDDSGAAQSDPVEPRPPDQRDRPDAAGVEHPDEPGVTDTGDIDLVIFDGDGVAITDDPDDPDTTAGLECASRTRVRVRDPTTESQPREHRIRDGGIRPSRVDRERELEEPAAVGSNPRNSRIKRVQAGGRIHHRLDTS